MLIMYDREVRLAALSRYSRGETVAAIARQIGVSRAAVRAWTADPKRALAPPTSLCFVCRGDACPEPTTYSYLLGQYLGDGYLVTTARVPRLRIACADDYPEIAAEVDRAMHVLSGNRVGAVQKVGCSDRGSYWMHWPCLFPQHGPGRKHERRIALAPWQEAIVAAHPWPLIRGLLHSDGCRVTNTVRRGGRRYSYPRWFFSNESRDILALMGRTLDAVGVEWRYNRPNCISVARRRSVELLDAHAGRKS